MNNNISKVHNLLSENAINSENNKKRPLRLFFNYTTWVYFYLDIVELR